MAAGGSGLKAAAVAVLVSLTTLLPVHGDPASPAKGDRTAASPAAIAVAASTSAGFHELTGSLYAVPPALTPYRLTSPVPADDTGVHDADGVRMFLVDGVMHDHPVAQAQYGLANLDSYRLTRDPLYLTRAEAQAQRLVDRKVVSRGAWFYPYDFDFELYDDAANASHAPWYSAMAQGQALSLFVRLYETTQDPAWRTAADATFASLQLGPAPDVPWVTWVDPSGYLWLEEYPRPGEQSEQVLNGHIFTSFGLYDYWLLTRDPRAATLLAGAFATVQAEIPAVFRDPGWLSNYSKLHHAPTAHYHPIHIAQLLTLQAITHNPVFAADADALRTDYPPAAVNGTVVLAPRTVTGYQFDSAGRVIGSKRLTLTRTTYVHTYQRQRIYRRGIYLRLAGSPLVGYWVPEAVGYAVLLGPTAVNSYSPARKLTFAAGTYTGSALSSTGAVVRRTTGVLTHASSAPVTATGVVSGVLSAYVSAGLFAGEWVPLRTGLTLR